MTAKFHPGERVEWHYRSAIGHGTILRIHKIGDSEATTEYAIRQHDHHPNEPKIVYHFGDKLLHERIIL